MAIKKNLIISLDEAAVAGEVDIVSLKTTSTGQVNITINGPAPKFNIYKADLEEALKEIDAFYVLNPLKSEIKKPEEQTFVVEHDEIPF